MISDVTPQEEIAVLLKYGTKDNAVFYWWGKTADVYNEWELWVCKKWQMEGRQAVGRERR
jgi:hypothetical protein